MDKEPIFIWKHEESWGDQDPTIYSYRNSIGHLTSEICAYCGENTFHASQHGRHYHSHGNVCKFCGWLKLEGIYEDEEITAAVIHKENILRKFRNDISDLSNRELGNYLSNNYERVSACLLYTSPSPRDS